jgi:hypothetical protein
MSIVLDLRGRTSHAGVPLVHPTSENVVLGNVFGIIKNLSFDTALNPWLVSVTGDENIASDDWGFSFWERQEREPGVPEGSTEVDLVLTSPETLIFVEVKMDAGPSPGPAHDPDRNQLVRNLDIGSRRADREGKSFAVIYITPEVDAPMIVGSIRAGEHGPHAGSLSWSSWGRIADALARSYRENKLHAVEKAFALDLLAYLAGKGLWRNTLEDDPIFYGDKLYRPLRAKDSPFIPYAERADEADETWRQNEWGGDGLELREFLAGLRAEDKLLLKVIAEAGGSIRQDRLMRSIPSIRGKTSASLRALKSHVNAVCKGRGRMPILASGTGSGANRVHEFNPKLGDLRQVVIEVASAFEIPPYLLED